MFGCCNFTSRAKGVSVAGYLGLRLGGQLIRLALHNFVLTPCSMVRFHGATNRKGTIMKHYEIVFLVHPSQSPQVPGMVDRYRKLVTDNQGAVHRLEDWGRRQLAYAINKVHKAHYILMNVECDHKVIAELEEIFRYNDAVIRHMVLRCKKAVTQASPLKVLDLLEAPAKNTAEVPAESDA